MKGKDGTRFPWDFVGLKLHVFFFLGGRAFFSGFLDRMVL